MQKDWKIGMLSGLLLVAAATLWLSTRPGLNTKARMPGSRRSLYSHNAASQQQSPPAPNTPNTTPAQTSASIETEQINAPDFTLHEQRATRFHIVRKGETLSDISYKYYGSTNKWQKILDANRSVIKDANKLRPGAKLIIPE